MWEGQKESEGGVWEQKTEAAPEQHPNFQISLNRHRAERDRNAPNTSRLTGNALDAGCGVFFTILLVTRSSCQESKQTSINTPLPKSASEVAKQIMQSVRALPFSFFFWQHLRCDTSFTVLLSHCTSQRPVDSQTEVGGTVASFSSISFSVQLLVLVCLTPAKSPIISKQSGTNAEYILPITKE